MNESQTDEYYRRDWVEKLKKDFELCDHERAQLERDLAAAVNERDELKAKLATAEKQIVDLNAEAERMLADWTDLKIEVTELRVNLATAREALKTYAECADGCTCGMVGVTMKHKRPSPPSMGRRRRHDRTTGNKGHCQQVWSERRLMMSPMLHLFWHFYWANRVDFKFPGLHWSTVHGDRWLLRLPHKKTPMLCFAHGGSEGCEQQNREQGTRCPKCSNKVSGPEAAAKGTP